MFMFDWSALMTSQTASVHFRDSYSIDVSHLNFIMLSLHTVTYRYLLCVILQGKIISYFILELYLRTLAIQGVFTQRNCFSLFLKILQETQMSSKFTSSLHGVQEVTVA
jgi:hypothetical protein